MSYQTLLSRWNNDFPQIGASIQNLNECCCSRISVHFLKIFIFFLNFSFITIDWTDKLPLKVTCFYVGKQVLQGFLAGFLSSPACPSMCLSHCNRQNTSNQRCVWQLPESLKQSSSSSLLCLQAWRWVASGVKRTRARLSNTDPITLMPHRSMPTWVTMGLTPPWWVIRQRWRHTTTATTVTPQASRLLVGRLQSWRPSAGPPPPSPQWLWVHSQVSSQVSVLSGFKKFKGRDLDNNNNNNKGNFLLLLKKSDGFTKIKMTLFSAVVQLFSL